MDKPEEQKISMSVAELAAKMVMIETLLEDARKQSKFSSEFMKKQNEMLEILIDVVGAIAADHEAPLHIRRRLTFAMKQVAGIGKPS